MFLWVFPGSPHIKKVAAEHCCAATTPIQSKKHILNGLTRNINISSFSHIINLLNREKR